MAGHRSVTCEMASRVLDRAVVERDRDLRPEQREVVESLRLVAIAAVSAVATATVVIAAGRTLLPDTPPPPGRPELIYAAAR